MVAKPKWNCIKNATSWYMSRLLRFPFCRILIQVAVYWFLIATPTPKDWAIKGHPIIVKNEYLPSMDCTDDMGVFLQKTDLTTVKSARRASWVRRNWWHISGGTTMTSGHIKLTNYSISCSSQRTWRHHKKITSPPGKQNAAHSFMIISKH